MKTIYTECRVNDKVVNLRYSVTGGEIHRIEHEVKNSSKTEWQDVDAFYDHLIESCYDHYDKVKKDFG